MHIPCRCVLVALERAHADALLRSCANLHSTLDYRKADLDRELDLLVGIMHTPTPQEAENEPRKDGV